MKFCPECGYQLDNKKLTICPNCQTKLNQFNPFEGFENFGKTEIVRCGLCKGTGLIETGWFSSSICPTCGGTGHVRI